jgi:large subunit ribosomal protein L35
MLAVRRLRPTTARFNATFASSARAADAELSKTTPDPPSAPLLASISSKAATALTSPEPELAHGSKDALDAKVEINTNGGTKFKGRRKYTTRRPYINLQRPREWSRPLAQGVLPAYDEALRYILWDSAVLTEEARQLKKQVEHKQELCKNLPDSEKQSILSELDALQEKVGIIEVQSQINRPEVRWKFRNGLGGS